MPAGPDAARWIWQGPAEVQRLGRYDATHGMMLEVQRLRQCNGSHGIMNGSQNWSAVVAPRHGAAPQEHEARMQLAAWQGPAVP
eukprot:180096-Pelagomonas_calceolata.AAC.1